MKQKLLILFILFSASLSAMAQNDIPIDKQPDEWMHSEKNEILAESGPVTRAAEAPIPSSIPYLQTSPDVNLMIRNISTSANKYTGTGNIQIPLFAVDLINYNIPVSLQYCASGIRLTDNASIVGLGWRLAAGGKITKVIRGKNDDFDDLAKTASIRSWIPKNFVSWRYPAADAQSDMYYFELPNLSGSFIFDSDKQIYTIPYQNIKIEFADNKFKIYDESGTCYYFNTTESTTESSEIKLSMPVTNVSSWFLDKIEFLNGDCVDFTYLQGRDYSYGVANYLSTLIVVSGGTPRIEYKQENDQDISVTTTMNAPKYLSSIRYRDQIIAFDYDENRTDLNGCKRLISISNKNTRLPKLSKKIKLEYNIFPNSSLKLISVSQEGLNGEIKPISNFEYYEDVLLPNRGSYRFDHWGYCNGVFTSRPKCPTIKLDCDFEENFPTGIVTQGLSREPVLDYTRSQSLKKIVYPNGGSREFIYDLHRGLNPRTNVIENAGGLRLRQIIEKENITAKATVLSYEYEGGVIYDEIKNYYLDNHACIFMVNGKAYERQYLFRLSARNLSTSVDYFGSSVVYSSVKERFPNGSSVKYDYVSLSEYPDLLPQLYHPTRHNGSIAKGPRETDGKTPKTIRSWGRNLLKEQTSYDANGIITQRQSFEYIIDSTKMHCIPGHTAYSTELIKIDTYNIAMNQYGLRYSVGEYFSVSCPVMLKKIITHKGEYNLPSETRYNYNSHNQISLISVSQQDGTWISKRFRYAQDFVNYDTKSVIGKMISRNARIPLEEITSRKFDIYAAVGRSFRFNEQNNTNVVLDSEKVLAEQTPINLGYFFEVSLTATGMKFNNYYKNVKIYLDYNATGQLLCYEDENGIRHSFVYRNTTRPIATVLNARHSENPIYNQVYFNDFESQTSIPGAPFKSGCASHYMLGPYTLDQKMAPGSYVVTFFHEFGWRKQTKFLEITNASTYPSVNLAGGFVDDISIIPQNAVISSCYHVPGWGNLSETDGRGRTTYTEYNGLGLPTTIKDDNRTVVKKFEYQ